MADLSDSPRVMPEHVRRAKASLPPQFKKEELAYLGRHQRLILMAISNLLKKSDSAYVTIGEVEKSYDALCESMGVAANHHTQLWNDVNELSQEGDHRDPDLREGRAGEDHHDRALAGLGGAAHRRTEGHGRRC